MINNKKKTIKESSLFLSEAWFNKKKKSRLIKPSDLEILLRETIKIRSELERIISMKFKEYSNLFNILSVNDIKKQHLKLKSYYEPELKPHSENFLLDLDIAFWDIKNKDMKYKQKVDFEVLEKIGLELNEMTKLHVGFSGTTPFKGRIYISYFEQ
jgi:hypothetical protein